MTDDVDDFSARTTPARSDSSEPIDLPTRLQPAERYSDLAVLGAGGMGEVHLVRDLQLGRDVALKRIHAELKEGDDVRRFLREVQVQGSLEHPSVVPVYDLGFRDDGAPWFTMKRVRGQTLFQVLRQVKRDEGDARAKFQRWKLLSIFTTVCRCIDSAHADGVLHRDLKPGNIMIGEYGEVHVLDWGLARVRHTKDTPSSRQVGQGAGQTSLGTAMGTPGYMSPEQAEGRLADLDERTDVYALGVILHELLFLEPMTTPGDDDPGGRTRVDSPGGDVPPELDALWRKATAPLPADRFPSARALADAVERFLDGERDEVRRRALAEEQVTLAAAEHHDTEAGRRRALQALGRALAFDPAHPNALRKLSALLAAPVKEVPRAAQVTLRKLERERVRTSLKATSLRMGIWAMSIAATMLMLGVKAYALSVMVLLMLITTSAALALLARSPLAEKLHLAGTLSSVVCLGTLGLALGPLVVIPTLAATQAMLFSAAAPLRERRWMLAASVIAVLTPALFKPLGATATVSAGSIVLTSNVVRFDDPSAPLLLLFLSILPVLTPAVLVGRLRDAFLDAERAVVVQAASLKQLIPGG